MGWLIRIFARDEIRGAWTPTFAAAGVKVAQNKGKYKAAHLTWWQKIEALNAQGKSEALAKELWETTETVLQELKV